MGGMGTATPLSTSHTPTSRTAKATICSGPGGTGGSVGTTVFFHRTTNNLLDVPRTANSSEEENSPGKLQKLRDSTREFLWRIFHIPPFFQH